MVRKYRNIGHYAAKLSLKSEDLGCIAGNHWQSQSRSMRNDRGTRWVIRRKTIKLIFDEGIGYRKVMSFDATGHPVEIRRRPVPETRTDLLQI